MTASRSVHESCLPPPFANAERPTASLVLFDAGVPIAWIARTHLGFGGFADERSAADGAWVAHVALARWVQRRRGDVGVPRLPKHPRLRVSDDAGDRSRWILADRMPIARLVDPTSVVATRTATTLVAPTPVTPPPGDGYTAFEIAVPVPADEVAMRGAAYTAYRAICRTGLPFRSWSLARHRTVARASA